MISLALFLVALTIVAAFAILLLGLLGLMWRYILIGGLVLLAVWLLRAHPGLMPIAYGIIFGLAGIALVPQRIVDEWVAKIYRAFQ